MATTTSPITSNQTLSQADFLQLLVTQMSSQDPLNPQSDTEFAAQLAQFTALQTAQTTQGNIATLQASQLIGSTVTAAPSDGSANVTGVVSAVVMNGSKPDLVIAGQPFDMSQIVSITPTLATANQ
ncbi:MAG TPA: flagellar hook capping FlgD N-terminal domain-containing protein [Verrucomicrobiae bacterium]|jgi:flagellar basal-body rod modification protein FlgD|nr:flagellar hook capping FlgD N-terminal domain-containing protein [Verrucomicrobiae bacterium]